MAIGNEELMHECFPKHSCLGTASMKYYNVTEEEDKKREASMEKKRVRKKLGPDGLNYPNQNTIIINIICQYFRDGKSTKKLN